MMVPEPILLLNNRSDPLVATDEVRRSDDMLTAVYDKANASNRYEGRFYDGGHKFDPDMQSDAFDWFDRWLDPSAD